MDEQQQPSSGAAGQSDAQLLEAFCVQVEVELERQRRVLESCVEQGRAARARDIESLDLATRELARHTEDALRADRDRRALTTRIERRFALGPGEVTLSAMIRRTPEPWRTRLLRAQHGLREAVASTRRLAESNGRFLRDGARTASRILADVAGVAAPATGYGSDGRQPGAKSISALLNVAG